MLTSRLGCYPPTEGSVFQRKYCSKVLRGTNGQPGYLDMWRGEARMVFKECIRFGDPFIGAEDGIK